MKMCFKCGVWKQLDEFYHHPHMADGHLNKCKSCTKIDSIKNYHDNFIKKRKYEAMRFKSQGRKAKIIEYQKTRRERNPEKYKARNAVSNAIRDGKITRLPCQKCGEEKSQAHHHDYFKPLDVTWLCFKCHRLEHGQLNVLK